MEPTIWFWVGFNAFVLAILALDLGVLHRKQRTIAVREALGMCAMYVAMAAIFAAGVFYFRGEQSGFEFVTGYLIELSLSVDNIFVFVLLFSYFAVPPQYQYRVLFWGIMGALVMRGIMIALGAQLIHSFAWIVLIFGAFLIITGGKMLILADAKPDMANNFILKTLRSRMRVTDEYHGEKFFIVQNGLRYATPLFLVLIMVEFTDLIFAVDSIPAIFAITQDPFIVYTSNVFAILGLRAMYFALADIVPRFKYLKYGLSLVLMVIGLKMILNYFYGGKFIPTELALLITVCLIGGSILYSLYKTRGLAADQYPLPTGWVPGSREQKTDSAR